MYWNKQKLRIKNIVYDCTYNDLEDIEKENINKIIEQMKQILKDVCLSLEKNGFVYAAKYIRHEYIFNTLSWEEFKVLLFDVFQSNLKKSSEKINFSEVVKNMEERPSEFIEIMKTIIESAQED
ncbi:hypothetical protein KY314_04025 [Candidatus Woesearchaeota archaeon]|nr:hypothetical protein [Candidatus Woesearchaeota archaeon]